MNARRLIVSEQNANGAFIYLVRRAMTTISNVLAPRDIPGSQTGVGSRFLINLNTDIIASTNIWVHLQVETAFLGVNFLGRTRWTLRRTEENFSGRWCFTPFSWNFECQRLIGKVRTRDLDLSMNY